MLKNGQKKFADKKLAVTLIEEQTAFLFYFKVQQ
jgi:hypothetical protein